MAAEEIGAAAGSADVECARCDEEDYNEKIADNGSTADGI